MQVSIRWCFHDTRNEIFKFQISVDFKLLSKQLQKHE